MKLDEKKKGKLLISFATFLNHWTFLLFSHPPWVYQVYKESLATRGAFFLTTK